MSNDQFPMTRETPGISLQSREIVAPQTRAFLAALSGIGAEVGH
jgi:hypothetical protein